MKPAPLFAWPVRPVLDTYRGLERCLEIGPRGMVRVFVGLIAGWWLYVPLHELLHALACRAAGGSVDRLEIDGIYGGHLLSNLFPFVVTGSAYAGQLTGFDTGGSDAVYLATDLGPFLLTLFPGVWALRAAGAARRGLVFGLSLPFALAPFLSLTGDAYEIGSILVTRISPWSEASRTALLRGDDLLKKLVEVGADGTGAAWSGLLIAACLGIGWAWATYALGGAVSGLLGRGPLPPING